MRRFIELIEIETARGGGGCFLGRSFCVFGFGGGIAFFFRKERVLLGLFTGGLGFLGFGFFSG